MRRVLTAVLATAGLVLAGCGAPHDPEVTFHAAGKTVNLEPTQYCDLVSENCAVRVNAAGVLRVPPGGPLQISVPGKVAETAWRVAFTYRNATGEKREDARSRLFTRGEQLAYTLTLPDAGDQLESVEVQQFGKRIEIDEQGEVQFVARGTWVLSVDDRQ